ncbi:hypothetical protein GOODEAATRI_028949 [Goodea atripinnis]|uniref:Sterile alpha motif domain-containing protein 9-like n=1 Tax=Goodea atripinnis TaxID=208336 RepID=A0ABV0P8N1_9TELE
MESVKETAIKLELPKNTSWVFCNGGIDNEEPSDINQWFINKGASVRDVISFLCRKDVLPNKRFLVIFLLLSTVREKMDPLVETFSTFWQELRGTDQILCLCDNENAFTSWKDLIETRCGVDISGRCIYELSFAEVNGTILSLWSKNRRAIRFLPCGGESKVPLEKKFERSLNALEVLCVNQCEGGNEDRVAIEENFYKGGNVSWKNSAKLDFADVADQVIKLLMYSYDEQTPRIPVLLMMDDFDDVEKVYDLQQVIETECTEKNIQSAKVILLNCMRSESSEVGLLVIDLLKKTPVFSPDGVRHDILNQVLSGEVKLESIERSDPRCNKNRTYYVILRKFEDVLENLKYRMKLNIDYLEKLYVNLGSGFGVKDTREQIAQNELFRCFREYRKMFCETESAHLLKNKLMNLKMELHLARQFLEREKADTYSGILSCLSKEISAERMEKVVRKYQFICKPRHNPNPKDKINLIYASVVLSHFKLESQCVMPYPELIKILVQVLNEPTPSNDSLPLFFIAVVLMWPMPPDLWHRDLGRLILQMKTAYHNALKEVYNGKSPIVHFVLGNMPGYRRLVHIRAIQRCITDAEEQFASLWRNGKIWKEKKVRELLRRVSGAVSHGRIQADTFIPHLRLEVIPMYQSQISGYADGSKVSFFLGFSMKGPLALDIEPQC